MVCRGRSRLFRSPILILFVHDSLFDAQFLRMPSQDTIEKHPNPATGEKTKKGAEQGSLKNTVD